MDEHTTPLPPVGPPATPDDHARSRSRRHLVIPSAVAALALGLVGAGVGYAATRSPQQDTASTSTQGTTGTQVMNPGFGGYGGGGGYGGYGGTDPSTSTQSQSQSTDATAKASGSQLKGLVRITTTLKYEGAKAAGTGMVLTSDGEVVTNHHVVAGATSIKVKVMSTGTTYTATVVGTDATDDVAVLQLSGASGLTTVTTDTDGVTKGEAVTAVGDGNGTVSYLSSATGSVIATDQSITTQSEGSAASENLTGLMEISSDVVPGYSGGATYDSDGEVVGMTTAASSGSSDIVGYAVPIAKVLSVADALESGTQSTKYTYGNPAFLGIALGDGTTVEGTYAGTPATDAGIAKGDVITAVGGTRTTTVSQLRAAIAGHSPGDRVSISWTDTSGGSHTATVTLATGPIA